MSFVPAYKRLNEREFRRKVEQAMQRLESCTLCPRRCGVDRLKGEWGACRSGATMVVSSAGPHFGEEPELVGFGGSGTIFMTNCNLSCVFCQNSEISQLGEGYECSAQSVARMMLALQSRGCHNINWVTPTHFMPQLLNALFLASQAGLALPVVYNCGGYESAESLAILDGVIDIYMPDFKYGTNDAGAKYSGVANYFDVAAAAIKEMHRQVGDLTVDNHGLAKRGLIVRHLVMPNDVAGTRKVIEFIAREISPDTYVNVMAQYRPMHRAGAFPEINRRITHKEYENALKIVDDLLARRPSR